MQYWNQIKSTKDIDQIVVSSNEAIQIIFKDSVSCGISAYAKERLFNGIDAIKDKAQLNYLDLLSFREVSNYIADKLNVIHQSPQIIVLKNEEVIHTVTHHSIDPHQIAKELA